MKFIEKVDQKVKSDGVYFIAEIGQNHQGSLKIAKKLVDSLIGTGVSAIKTAKRDIDTCLSEEQKSQLYENPNSFGRTYYEHRKALELSLDEFNELKLYSELKGFDFISSFTDLNSLNFLTDINLDCLKIASQRMADLKLLEEVDKNGTLNFSLNDLLNNNYKTYDFIDINDMIMKGLTQSEIVDIIDTCTFEGLSAKIKLMEYKKI